MKVEVLKKKKKRRRRKKDSPYPRKRIKERWFMKKESIHYPPKISTHMHILVKDYDLFLLWVPFLT
jgi:hypothetical protein